MGANDADGGELTRVNSYQWPSGHIGHLTGGQREALDRFKNLCLEKGYYEPGDDKSPPTHDDETLLRYLRARKFIPSEAFTQFKTTEDWRKETKLDELYETIDIQEYEQTRRLYPQWTGRRDKRGIPFYIFEVGAVDAKAVSVYSNSKDDHHTTPNPSAKTPWKMLKLFALYENLCRFVLPLCSAIPDRTHNETPVSQSSNVVDLSGVGFAKMWSLRNHMSDASTLATAHYPETLDRIFVVGAPSFFPTIWQWAQRWFDPITVAKIHILTKSNMTETLAKFVDMDNIPQKYGGNLEWNFGDMPYLEPAIANSLRWKEDIKFNGHRTLPIGPIKWQYDEDGDLVATAIGSEDGIPRSTVIAGLHPESGVARLALSPGRSDKNVLFHAAKIPSKTAEDASKDVDEGPPEIKIDSQGEKQTIVEPNTVGDAYKEMPLPQPQEPAPSIVDQAKTIAGQVVEQASQLPGTVMMAVGMGKKQEEEVKAPKEDPEVDAMPGSNVEEFLRSKTVSQPQE